MIYLGEEIFYFDKNDISKPEYPKASPKKERFIEKAKQEITDAINAFGFEEEKSKRGIYKVYIIDFTNEDTETDVRIIKDDKIMWYSQIMNQMVMDDGTTLKDIAYFRGTYNPPCDWSDKNIRKLFKRELELSVCEFTVEIP